MTGWFVAGAVAVGWMVERLTSRELARQLIVERKFAEAWKTKAHEALGMLRHPSQFQPAPPEAKRLVQSIDETIWRDFVANHQETE